MFKNGKICTAKFFTSIEKKKHLDAHLFDKEDYKFYEIHSFINVKGKGGFENTNSLQPTFECRYNQNSQVSNTDGCVEKFKT